MNLVTNLQPAKQVVPAVGALDHPTASLESRILLPLALLLAASFDVGEVPTSRGRATQLRVVVPLVAAKVLARFLLGRGSPHHDGVQRGVELFHVVPVRAGER